jgi:hypothetical protein
MPFEGRQLQPAEIAERLWKVGFRDFTLVEMVAVCLSESQGFTHARNDNVGEDGQIRSRDVGLFQINIPVRDIGTKRERDLYGVDANIRAARKLFDTIERRFPKVKRRRFNPWYAFTLGWATFPGWWVFTKKTDPRRWDPTGRYIQKAVVGVANFYASRYQLTPRPFVELPAPPPKPTKRPPGDGPRPVKNDGRGTRI